MRFLWVFWIKDRINSKDIFQSVGSYLLTTKISGGHWILFGGKTNYGVITASTIYLDPWCSPPHLSKYSISLCSLETSKWEEPQVGGDLQFSGVKLRVEGCSDTCYSEMQYGTIKHKQLKNNWRNSCHVSFS